MTTLLEASATTATSGGGSVRRRSYPWLIAVLGLLLVLAAAISLAASRRNSLTFDEVFMIPSGARGFETGDFEMTIDHPPLMQYLYGLPVYLSDPTFPAEANGRWGMGNRFRYGREFFFGSGNDPERLTFLARAVAALVSIGLSVTVATFAWRAGGPVAGVVAGVLTAYLPDVLAHSGIAYNDVPLALAMFGGLWAVDAAARRPALWRVAGAAALSGLALTVKFSALALFPAAAVLLLGETWRRRTDAGWRRSIGRALPLALLVCYLAVVLVYRGDFALDTMRRGLLGNIQHVEGGHGVPIWLLGERSYDGFWYFFPVMLFVKTPAALHVLVGLGVIGFIARAKGLPFRANATRLLDSPMRMPLVGAVVFGLFLIVANLNIGTRHALPIMPFVLALTGVGIARLWDRARRGGRILIGGLVTASVVSALSFYPFFITYVTDYVPDREQGYRIAVDSNLDWGQGLLELRRFMHEEGIERVYLSYFGSALPEGYGIDYVPLPSFFALQGPPTGEPAPRFVVISATNLVGTYLSGDPYAEFRTGEPYAVLGNSMFVYRVAEARER